MDLPDNWQAMNVNQRFSSLLFDLKARDSMLGGLVEGTQASLADPTSWRAMLDANLALMAAETAKMNSDAANRAASRLTLATWGLVIATVVLVVVTIVIGVAGE